MLNKIDFLLIALICVGCTDTDNTDNKLPPFSLDMAVECNEYGVAYYEHAYRYTPVISKNGFVSCEEYETAHKNKK